MRITMPATAARPTDQHLGEIRRGAEVWDHPHFGWSLRLLGMGGVLDASYPSEEEALQAARDWVEHGCLPPQTE